MGRIGVVLASALIATALAGCGKPKPATTLTADGVKADVHSLIAAFNAHDAAKTVSHDAPDFVGMYHGMANNLGPAADLSITRLQVADPKARIDLSNETVDVAKAGDMAIYRATYAATSTDPKANRTVVEHGNLLIGYRIGADGTPRVAWDSFSDTPAT
jgi:ketosteroid isomerase-like protein